MAKVLEFQLHHQSFQYSAQTLTHHRVSSVGCQRHPNTLGIIHSSIHSFYQQLLRVYCLSEAVTGTEDPKLEEIQSLLLDDPSLVEKGKL